MKIYRVNRLAFTVCGLNKLCWASDDALVEGQNKTLVTCGSAIKLRLADGKSPHYLLHSAEVNWSTGSGQQVVTMIRKSEASEKSTLWQVREAHDSKPCTNGQPIKCGETIKLMHLSTKRNLHTHKTPSVLSPNSQEVSAFGDGKDEGGKSGDSSDNWTILCAEDYWGKGGDIRLRHLISGAYLSSSSGKKFDQNNCPRCPIIGHLEVKGVVNSDQSSTFRAEIQGLFF